MKLGGGAAHWTEIWYAFTDLEWDVKIVWLLFFFSPALTPPPAPPTSALSNTTDTDTSPSPSFQLTRPKTVFSTPILPDMSLGHLVAGGNWLVSHLRRLVLFSPEQKNSRGTSPGWEPRAHTWLPMTLLVTILQHQPWFLNNRSLTKPITIAGAF